MIRRLINKTNESSELLKEDLNKNGKILSGTLSDKNRSFNALDFYYILCRAFNQSLIKGWKFQMLVVILSILAGLFLVILYPSDMGTDTGCPVHDIDLTNISSIDQRVLDAITGNEQKFQQNIKYLFIIMTFIHAIVIALLSSDFSSGFSVSSMLQQYYDVMLIKLFKFFRYFLMNTGITGIQLDHII